MRSATHVVLFFFAVFFSVSSFSYGPPLNNISGRVVNSQGEPICALVLANGSHAFSCDGDGHYDFFTVADEKNEVTIQAFAFQHAPYLQTFQASVIDGQYSEITLGAVNHAPVMVVDYDLDTNPDTGFHTITGTIKDRETSSPICALVLFNGIFMFSCNEKQGRFRITSVANASGELELMVFAAGFFPYSSKVQIDNTDTVDYRNLSCGKHLEPGIPFASDYTICHSAFAVGYNTRYKNPDWVQYSIHKDSVDASPERASYYEKDPNLYPSDQASTYDFSGTGYGRGHMAPADTVATDYATMRDTFYLTNISPQNPTLNGGLWVNIEQTVRDLTNTYDNLYVVTGPAGIHSGSPEVHSGVKIPENFYKVIVDLETRQGGGFWVPNSANTDSNICAYTKSIDEIEALIGKGFDFFKGLSVKEALKIEADTTFFGICGNGQLFQD